MKKGVIVLLFLFVLGVGGGLYSEDIVWGSMYGEGNFVLGADVSYESGTAGGQLAVYPGAEMLFYKPVIGDFAFIDIGASLKGRIGVPVTLVSSLTAGAGVFGTVHFGFRGLDFPLNEYLEKVDVFAEIGVKFDFLPASETDTIGFAYIAGINYFLSDGLAVGGHYSSWGGESGGGISVIFKFGETPKIKGMDLDTGWVEDLKGASMQPYLLQFYTIYYSAHVAGGFYPGDYKPGTGAVYQVKVIDSDGESSYMVEKALLKKLDGGDLLWMLKWYDDEEDIYYEFVTDSSYKIKSAYYESEDEGILKLAADEDLYADQEYHTWADYETDGKKNVKVEVEAGSFVTTEYSYEDENGRVKWWLSDKVPGSLVSYMMENDSDVMTAELFEITRNNKERLYK